MSFLILFTGGVTALGTGFAPVRNFTRQQYGAASQNWAVAQDPAGRVYFANGNGLLKFDGTRWSLFHLPNYTSVRSIYYDDVSDRIFAGGSGEFGFFHTDPKTLKMTYVSWSAGMSPGDGNFTEIWNIHPFGEGKVAFQGDYKIFISDGTHTQVVMSSEKLTASGLIRGNLYAGTWNGIIFRVNGSGLEKVGETGNDSRIVSLLPLGEEGILVVTASAGLFYMGHDGIQPLRWPIVDFLKENQTFCATYSDGRYAFGTVINGAVVTDSKGNDAVHINKATGLQNNTVLGLGFDFASNLWLCLDNGIGYAMVDSPVFNLLGSDSDSGAGYASLLNGNTLYMATNRGLFTTGYPFTDSETPPRLTRIHSGQVWGLDTIEGDIFISADDGLFTIGRDNPGLPRQVQGVGGSWYVAPLMNLPGKALASTYSGFYLLSHDGRGWRSEGKIEGYDDAGGKFVEDADGNIWITHWIKGVYRLTPAPDYKRFSVVKLYTSEDGLPSERDNSIALYDGNLRIATASGEFFRTEPDGTLNKDVLLSELIPINRPAHFFPMPSGMTLALSPVQVWKMERDRNGTMHIDSVSLRMVASSLIPGFEHVGLLDGNNMLVSHQEGFYSIQLDHLTRGRHPNEVFIEALSSGDSVLFSGLPKGSLPKLKIPYSQNSLTFSFASPEYRYEGAVLYSCLLENYDREWSTPSETASKEYTHLNEGNYTLRVRAFNTVTGETAETEFPFSISPPWYRSVWANIIYAILILAALYAAYCLLTHISGRKAAKIRDQKEAEMEKMRREAEKEAIRKDYEIAALKSEQLELDIKHKSSELSNTAMNVIRKNEILLDISARLSRLHEKAEAEGKSSPALKKEVTKLQELIQENISHDDDWKRFNQNFDIVYADFTSHLAERYPDLTLAERRLCCYLKMGLSSKEIAPILSISPKSVEMNRYRLRKKLGLEREDNLVEYLQGI